MFKVSVIIPIYKAERYIERCARSLFEQTLDDIEYIFVDDCTPDKSIDVLEGIVTQYPNRGNQVRILKMPVNGGQAVATRKALEVAAGEYVIRCDSDDSVPKDAYETLYRAAVVENYDIVICDKLRVDAGGGISYVKSFRQKSSSGNYKEEMISNLLALYGIPSLWSSLMKRSLFDNDIHYPVKKMGEDVALLLQVLFYGKRVGYVNMPLYTYYTNSNSTCTGMSANALHSRFDDLRENTSLMIDFLKDKGIEKKYEKELVVSKNAARNQLFPLLKTRERIEEWAGVYPEIYWKVLFSKYIDIGQKKAILSKMLRRIFYRCFDFTRF